MKELVKDTAGHNAQINQFAVAANDIDPVENKKVNVSDMPKDMRKRISDLEWQIRFTQIHLNRWRALEDGSWTSLKTLQKSAKRELNSLILQ